MGRHKTSERSGHCEVVEAVFIFGAKLCQQPTTEKVTDPVEGGEHWICAAHSHQLFLQEHRAKQNR